MDHDEKVCRPTSDDDVQAATPSIADAESFGVNERGLIRKLDYTLLPAVTVLYLMSFLDRSNGSSSKCELERRMAADFNLESRTQELRVWSQMSK